ncbi:hypothetical protein D3C71_1995010 [compost metagenome]
MSRPACTNMAMPKPMKLVPIRMASRSSARLCASGLCPLVRRVVSVVMWIPLGANCQKRRAG